LSWAYLVGLHFLLYIISCISIIAEVKKGLRGRCTLPLQLRYLEESEPVAPFVFQHSLSHISPSHPGVARELAVGFGDFCEGGLVFVVVALEVEGMEVSILGIQPAQREGGEGGFGQAGDELPGRGGERDDEVVLEGAGRKFSLRHGCWGGDAMRVLEGCLGSWGLIPWLARATMFPEEFLGEYIPSELHRIPHTSLCKHQRGYSICSSELWATMISASRLGCQVQSSISQLDTLDM